MVDKMLARALPDRPSMVGYGTYEDTLNVLEQALREGPYLLGESFSAADVYVGSQIAWGLMTKGIEPRQTFLEYVERCRQRPAAQNAAAREQRFAAELAVRT
jgi:glutathione S-transferase